MILRATRNTIIIEQYGRMHTYVYAGVTGSMHFA